eukprot:CAMPEP_0175142852 /NCGR_PEP_ID=MMETSP0087-20121206/13062_1 /TAXON_ID=136419 /ORGANISM="Unknown Unknown, Strain D1" /LENGTH=230 /DNA_ID=CAMNT_0016426767 /DNA_START=22 /DNA_END=711 /DNA_ORIENTATION=+
MSESSKPSKAAGAKEEVDDDALFDELYGGEGAKPKPEAKDTTSDSAGTQQDEMNEGTGEPNEDEEDEEEEESEEESESEDDLAIVFDKGGKQSMSEQGTIRSSSNRAHLKGKPEEEKKDKSSSKTKPKKASKSAAEDEDDDQNEDDEDDELALPKPNTKVYEIDLDKLTDRPWRKPGADLTDYFNYGFDEDTWREYCNKQITFRLNRMGRNGSSSSSSNGASGGGADGGG